MSKSALCLLIHYALFSLLLATVIRDSSGFLEEEKVNEPQPNTTEGEIKSDKDDKKISGANDDDDHDDADHDDADHDDADDGADGDHEDDGHGDADDGADGDNDWIAQTGELQPNTSEVGERKSEQDDKKILVAKLATDYRVTSPSEFFATYGKTFMNSSYILCVEKFIDRKNPSLGSLINVTFAEAFIKSLSNGSEWVIMEEEYLRNCIVIPSVKFSSKKDKWNMPVYINDKYFTLDEYPMIIASVIAYKHEGNDMLEKLHRIQFLPEGYKREFEITFAMVTHHSIHEAFMELEDDCLSDAEKSENAAKKLKSVLEVLANEVNEAFGTLRGQSGDFRVNTMKIVITKKVDELLCLEKWRLENQTIHGNKAYIECFTDVVELNPFNLPEVDMVTIFTRDTLIFRKKLAKFASFPETMCIIKNMMIVNFADFGFTKKITTQALAVSLDIKFDGDRIENKNCQPEDNYIMSNNFTETLGNKNLFTFSPCASLEADLWISWLDGRKYNCIDKKKGRSNPNKPEKTVSLLAGEILNLNDQCRLIVGPKSYYCGNKKATKKNVVCKSIRCFANERCKSIPKFVLDGTSCANGRWCRRGQCIPAARAPKLLNLPALKSGKCEETTTAGPEMNLTLNTDAGIPTGNRSYQGSSINFI